MPLFEALHKARAGDQPGERQTRRIRETPELSALAASALLLLCAVGARSQDITCPSSPSSPINTSPSGVNFFKSFVGADGSGLACYGIPLQTGSGSAAEGDLNSTYYVLYYSITNALAQTGEDATTPNFELVIVGNFPDARYFSLSHDDMHYANAQHLADFAIDPVGGPGSSYVNPFKNGETYATGQWYIVPVSLGAVPGSTTSGCGSIPSSRTTFWMQRNGTPPWTGTP